MKKIKNSLYTSTLSSLFIGLLLLITFSCSKNTDSTHATVSTLAGNFSDPTGIAIDANGNIYIADNGNQRIAKITAGNITTFAGGNLGSADGTGTAAAFTYPSGLTLAPNGNMFVADYGNGMIRKITNAGVVTTFAGMLNVPLINDPTGVAADGSGNVYVAEQDGNRILKINSAGTITVFAGSGNPGSTDATGAAASFDHPYGLTLDAAGNIYVADTYNHKIRKITPAGAVTTLAGSGIQGAMDGTGNEASFDNPAGIALDTRGNLYIADSYNNKIRKVTSNGKVSTVAGTGQDGLTDGTGNAKFSRPAGIAIDGSGQLYVADSYNDKIRKIIIQ